MISSEAEDIISLLSDPDPFDGVPNYHQSRYERLVETLDEYFGGSGEDMGYLVFVKDLVKAYKELVDGPQKQLQELTNLKHALPVDFLS